MYKRALSTTDPLVVFIKKIILQIGIPVLQYSYTLHSLQMSLAWITIKNEGEQYYRQPIILGYPLCSLVTRILKLLTL